MQLQIEKKFASFPDRCAEGYEKAESEICWLNKIMDRQESNQRATVFLMLILKFLGNELTEIVTVKTLISYPIVTQWFESVIFLIFWIRFLQYGPSYVRIRE